MLTRIPAGKKDKWRSALIFLLIGVGVLLRLVVFFQNRNLMIDEANLARNLYERSFAGLAQPLDYAQYAPPGYLWLTKCFALVAGYSEPVLRLTALLSGVGVLICFYSAGRRISGTLSVIYPLLLLVAGPIYLRYSTELKQYASDAFIALALVLLALKLSPEGGKRRLFIISWCIAGSLAIWSSMPSVFVLAGVGCYYLYDAYRKKSGREAISILLPSMIWVAQFLAYYFLVLKPQIGSDYLQQYHQSFFLHWNLKQGSIARNFELLLELMGVIGGHWTIPAVLNILLLVLGTAWLARRQPGYLMLVGVPVAAMLIAASLRQYTLIPRVTLFSMPLILLLIAAGCRQILELRWLAVKIVSGLAAIISVVNFTVHSIGLLPLKLEQMTTCLNFLRREKLEGDQVYVHHLAAPAYTYYTTIHPDKADWNRLQGAHLLNWDTDYEALIRSVQGRSAFLYSFIEPEKLDQHQKALTANRPLQAQIKDGLCQAYVYGEVR